LNHAFPVFLIKTEPFAPEPHIEIKAIHFL